jgi:hypothetical protein
MYVPSPNCTSLNLSVSSAMICLQAQRALAVAVAAACIAWGTPSISYAMLYDSTTTAKNTAAVRTLAGAAAGKGVYQDTSVALVDKDGKDTVLYTALKSYAKQANTWLETQIEVSHLHCCGCVESSLCMHRECRCRCSEQAVCRRM